MTTETTLQPTDGVHHTEQMRRQPTELVRRLPETMSALRRRIAEAIPVSDSPTRVRDRLAPVLDQVPTTLTQLRISGRRGMRDLLAMPDTSIRPLAASLAGLTAGLYVGRAPRLVKLAGMIPTLIVGSITLFRPSNRTARSNGSR